MAQQQEEGWPFGLNRRVGMERNGDVNGSISFNTLLTGSPTMSCTDSSSDLDTESTGSFFHDKSITLGSLIGISSILELSRRSTRGKKSEPVIQNKKISKTKTWFLSLCSRLSPDAVSTNMAPSLGHFLEAERRAASSHRRIPTSPNVCGPDDFSQVLDPNSLFVDGQIAPPQSNNLPESNGGRIFTRGLLSHDNADEPSLLFSCLCGKFSH